MISPMAMAIRIRLDKGILLSFNIVIPDKNNFRRYYFAHYSKACERYILYIAATSHPYDCSIPYILYMVAISHPCDCSIPYILYMAAISHPCDRSIPYILYMAAISHPCDRSIPYILYIKGKPYLMLRFALIIMP
jgi:hypothetical protein